MDAEPTKVDPEAAGLLCPACGYDLRGTSGDRCSECGQVVDRALLSVSGFPWARRRELGRIRTYLQTVWRVIVDSRTLAHEASRPQNLRDAKVFRRITAILLALVLVSPIAGMLLSQEGLAPLAMPTEQSSPLPGWALDLFMPWSAGATISVVLPLSLVMLSFYVTGVQSMLFRLRDASRIHQERAVAMAYYAAAPILLFVPAALLFAGAYATSLGEGRLRSSINSYLAIFAVGFIFLAILGTIVRTAQWARRVRHGHAERSWLAAAGLAGLWLLGFTILCCLVPWGIGFLWIVADSLR